MKNVLKFVLLVVAFSWAVLVQANNIVEPIIKIECAEGTSDLTLHLANLLNERTSIVLKDVNGTAFYTETVNNKASFAKKMDLSKLKEGRYLLVVEHERIECIQPIMIQTGSVEVLTAQRVELRAPAMEFIANKMAIQLAPSPKAKRVRVTILKGDEIVFTTDELLTSSIKKQYNLNNLHNDTYMFMVTVDERSYYKEFTIEQ